MTQCQLWKCVGKVEEVEQENNSGEKMCIRWGDPQVTPPFFNSLADILVNSRIDEAFSAYNWQIVTNKQLYKKRTENFKQTKVENHAGKLLTDTWGKIIKSEVSSSLKETLFLIAHNKLPTRERLFRVGLAVDPYCESCLFDGKTAVICDREHFFCSCVVVHSVWSEIRKILVDCLHPSLCSVSNVDLITLNFPKDNTDYFCAWLLAHYLNFTWKTVHVLGAKLSREKVFGYLKFKYKSDQLGSRRSLPVIQALSL